MPKRIFEKIEDFEGEQIITFTENGVRRVFYGSGTVWRDAKTHIHEGAKTDGFLFEIWLAHRDREFRERLSGFVSRSEGK